MKGGAATSPTIKGRLRIPCLSSFDGRIYDVKKVEIVGFHRGP